MSGPLAAPTPRASGCFAHSHSGLRPATATRVPTGSLSDGGFTGASSSLHWYRVSSFLLNPILTLRKHDAHPEDAVKRLIVRPHTRCLRSACPPSSFTLRPEALASLGGIVTVSLGHTLSALRSPALPCLRCTAHRQRQSTKSPQNLDFAAILSKNLRQMVEHRKAVGQSAPPKPKMAFGSSDSHWRFYRPIGRVRPAYSAF